MTTPNPTDTIAEALAEHRFREPERICSCGVLCGLVCDGLTYAAHQASVIAALPDIAIVALPEPDTTLRLRHWEVGDISVAEGTGLVWADLEPHCASSFDRTGGGREPVVRREIRSSPRCWG